MDREPYITRAAEILRESADCPPRVNGKRVFCTDPRVNLPCYCSCLEDAASIVDAIAPAIRAAALEEAARVAERTMLLEDRAGGPYDDPSMGAYTESRDIAAAIRALINDPPPTL
jgi:hypothetical protein